jgi:hypothetical protein
MSIQDFRTQLEAGKEKSSLFVALGRLSRFASLKDLVFSATVDGGGWAYWSDATPEPAGLAEVGA